MTETLTRPLPPPPRPVASPASPLLAGVRSALLAALTGLLLLGVPLLAVRFADDRSTAGVVDALRAAGALWLLAHGATLDLAGGRLSLAPLGLCAVPVWVLARSGRAAAAECRTPSVRAAVRLAFATAVPYAVLVGILAQATATPDLHAPLPQALAAGLLVGALGTLVGVLRTGRLWRPAWLALPSWLLRQLPAVAAASAVLLAGGALLVGTMLAVHLPAAAEAAGSGEPGVVGGLGVLLLGVSLVPNAVVWGAGWLAGPGFAVGAGTAVGPFAYAVGPVPGVPLLAALPGSGVAPWIGAIGLLVPVAAGLLAGRLLAGGVGERLACAGLCGALWGLLSWLAGGAVGGGRLAVVGPAWSEVGLAVAAEVAVGLLLAQSLGRRAVNGD